MGRFRGEYLPGFQIGRTRIVPTLPLKLLCGDYDVVVKCVNGRFALPASFLSARLRRKPFILWTGIWMRINTRFHRFLFPITRYIYHHANAIVVYGEHVRRYLVDEGVPPDRIFVAPHAVDNSNYNRIIPEQEKAGLRDRLGIAPGKKVVLYLGRLEAIKGISYLVEAFSSMGRKDSVLVLAGTGSERPALERLVHERHLQDSVRFTGYVPVEQAILYYAVADVFVLPSITAVTGRETWGLVVNEAFNQGLPVIAAESVGAAAGGLLQDGVTGFVVPERDSGALAKALDQILADTQLRQRLSENARERISRWTQEEMVIRFQQAIAYALQSRR
jgi:glycosyltransferase involved in cell wall biosynthesis